MTAKNESMQYLQYILRGDRDDKKTMKETENLKQTRKKLEYLSKFFEIKLYV